MREVGGAAGRQLDAQFLRDHQEKLQARYNGVVEFASTLGGQCAYHHDLYRVPVVVTVNNDTSNLNLLYTDDWMSKNVVIAHYPPQQTL